jgi:RNA polymerase sigma-70 factor, ECF subfamily
MASPLRTVELSPGSRREDESAEERQRHLADFRLFYLEHFELVRRAVARLFGPGADADDLVQEVFLIALRKRADFAGLAAPSTWLYGIARKVAMAARRRARLRCLLGLAEVPEQAHGQTPHEIFEDRESSQRLYALLNSISEKKRTVFILYEMEGLPGETIARIVGCPLKTVWTRLHHARRELQGLAANAIERS